MNHPIPPKALAQHIAILGKTGSGKTTAAKSAIENILDSGGRVCIVDPTGAWWGLKSSASGKSSGYPVVIFGGLHADLPLAGTHGEAIAEIVGTSNTPAIIDTSQLRIAERTRFFADFADALMRKNRGPLHLVVDEAHVFMPQGKVPDPQSGVMLAAGCNMVSGGRSRGLRITLISQRPAKLHKDALTQVETLIAMRLIAPQDRKAVEEWIKDNAEPDKGREIIASLASLKTGQGWIWAPEVGVLERVQFPRIKTFDSSAAPIDTIDGHGPVLAAIDRDAIAAKLSSVAADALANDPATLKKRIVELEKKLRETGSVRPTSEQLKAAEEKGFERGCKLGVEAQRTLIMSLRLDIDGIFEKATPKPATPRITVHPQNVARSQATEKALKEVATRALATASDSELTSPERRILDAIAWLENTNGKEDQEQTAVAFMANYTFGAGAFNNPRGSLKAKGLVEYVPGNRIKLTVAGRALANPPDETLTADELHKRVLDRLPGPERRLLKPLLASYPEPMDGPSLAEAAGYQYGAGAFNNPRGRLNKLGLIKYLGGGTVVADGCLFPT